MGMPEYEIEQQIEKYWENFRKQLNDEDAEELDRLLMDQEAQCVDPTEVNPIQAVDVATWLDPTPLMDILKSRYPYFNLIKKTVPAKIPILRVLHTFEETESTAGVFESFRRRVSETWVHEYTNL